MMRAPIDQDFILVFPVFSGGALVPGLLPGNFTATALSPDGATATVVAVAETATAGIYELTLTEAILGAGGSGVVRVVVESAAPLEVFSFEVDVFNPSRAVQANVTWDASANFVRVNAWVQGDSARVTTGLQDASCSLYDRAGTLLAGPVAAAAPDAQGVFEFDLTAPALAVGEHATYLLVSIDQDGTPVRTYTGAVGVTFSRTS